MHSTGNDGHFFINLIGNASSHGVEQVQESFVGVLPGTPVGQQCGGKGRQTFLPFGVVLGTYREQHPKGDGRIIADR